MSEHSVTPHDIETSCAGIQSSETSTQLASPALAVTAQDLVSASANEPALMPVHSDTVTAPTVSSSAVVPASTISIQAVSPTAAAVTPQEDMSPLQPMTEINETLVFPIGQLGYDFGNEQTLDYFIQQMGDVSAPFNPVKMAKHLNAGDDANMEESIALIWTLTIDGTPIYAIHPDNQFAVLSFIRMTKILQGQALPEKDKNRIERISVAGNIVGETRLYNGTIIPTVSPTLRGMYSWSMANLIDALYPKDPPTPAVLEQIENYLERIYYAMRNQGFMAQDRALNFAGVNAYNLKSIYADAFKEHMFLDTINVVKSPISRPNSDCWDVELVFFNPQNVLEKARKIYRYTVDVYDVMPVTVGDLRSWYVY